MVCTFLLVFPLMLSLPIPLPWLTAVHYHHPVSNCALWLTILSTDPWIISPSWNLTLSLWCLTSCSRAHSLQVGWRYYLLSTWTLIRMRGEHCYVPPTGLQLWVTATSSTEHSGDSQVSNEHVNIQPMISSLGSESRSHRKCQVTAEVTDWPRHTRNKPLCLAAKEGKPRPPQQACEMQSELEFFLLRLPLFLNTLLGASNTTTLIPPQRWPKQKRRIKWCSHRGAEGRGHRGL